MTHPKTRISELSNFVRLALSGQLKFRPTPPGHEKTKLDSDLKLRQAQVQAKALPGQLSTLKLNILNCMISHDELESAATEANISAALRHELITSSSTNDLLDWSSNLTANHSLDRMGLLAVELVNSIHCLLLDVPPLTEIEVNCDEEARAILSFGWLAIIKRGTFPITPSGQEQIRSVLSSPCGSLHFVSASDLDGGFNYTLGIALSPECQALRDIHGSFGLDGELIVPGQAVSPIPPTLAMSSRMFSAGI
ncbi:MAG: hypothetical protein IPH75_14765 [bacterium]|nr:hypothetical protein [bacterium]